jgi:AraC-like DNA-binding protein
MAVRALIEKLTPPPATSFIHKRWREPKFVPFWHFHPEYQLTLVLRGQGKRFVGDHVSRFREGDLVLTGPNLPHMWCSSPGPVSSSRPHEAVIIQFPESVFGDRFFNLPELGAVKRLLEKSARGIEFGEALRRTITSRMIRMGQERGIARLIALLELLRILSQAPAIRVLASRTYRPSVAAPDRDRIDRICRFIGEHATEPIRLAQAATASHMSIPAFTRFFRKCTRQSFVEYLTELRIGHACRLLLESDRTVSQIGRDSGFRNLSNFNRRFHRLKGMSPREFRRGYPP